jgi:hypothetical protein
MLARSSQVPAGSGSFAGRRLVEGSGADIASSTYVRRAHGVIWLLTMYPKNVAENIPAHVLRQIRKEVEDG